MEKEIRKEWWELTSEEQQQSIKENMERMGDKCPQCGTTHEDTLGHCPEASSHSILDCDRDGNSEEEQN